MQLGLHLFELGLLERLGAARGGLRFEEIGVESGVATSGEGGGQATMGIALGDVDGNGRPDLFSTNFSSDTNTLHANIDERFFEDQTNRYGLGVVSRPFLGWGCGLFDFDCDCDEDLFIANGHVYPETATHNMDSWYDQEILLFQRVGSRFERIADAGPLCKTRYHGRATAFGDIDGDGDVDVLMTTLNGPVHVFRNDSPPQDRLVVRLDYQQGNPHGYGSMIELIGCATASSSDTATASKPAASPSAASEPADPSGQSVQRRWITGGGSYQSVDAPVAYFGLSRADPKAKRSLKVTWPDGKTTELADVRPNCRLVVHRATGKLEALRLDERPANRPDHPAR